MCVRGVCTREPQNSGDIALPSIVASYPVKKHKGLANMYSDGHEVDGSWVLRVYVTDLQVERSLRVKGELHIGGVMLRLVEDLREYRSQPPFSLYFLSTHLSPLSSPPSPHVCSFSRAIPSALLSSRINIKRAA